MMAGFGGMVASVAAPAAAGGVKKKGMKKANSGGLSPDEPLSPVQQPYSELALMQQQHYFSQMAMQQQQQQYLMQQQQQTYGGGMGMYGAPVSTSIPQQQGYGGYGYGMQPSAAVPSMVPAVASGQRYVSPSLPRYASPLVQSGAPAPPPPAASTNERFRSPMRGAGIPPPAAASVALAGGSSPVPSGGNGGGYAASYQQSRPAPVAVPVLGAGLDQIRSKAAMSIYQHEAMKAQQAAKEAQEQRMKYLQQYGDVLDNPMAGMGGAAAAVEDREGLPYSRKPRPVDYQPYEMKVGEFLLFAFEC